MRAAGRVRGWGTPGLGVLAPRGPSSPGPPPLGYLVLKVVLAQVTGLGGSAVPVGQSPLPRMGKAVTRCPRVAPPCALRPPQGASPPSSPGPSRPPTHQALQPLGHDGRKPALPGQLRDEEDVLRRGDLVGAVGPAWRQKGLLGTRQAPGWGGLGWGRGSPNCWMARSALQGSSSVMCTLRRWFGTRRSAWREMPELEASEMMATS